MRNGIAWPAQIITTIAGTEFTFPARPIPAVSAPFGTVTGIAFDGKGNLYVADPDNSIVARIAPDGTLTVVAGNGKQGYSGDGGPATAGGNLYIADSGNLRVRKVAGGIITTIAGNGSQIFSGDSGPATSAGLQQPFTSRTGAIAAYGRLPMEPSQPLCGKRPCGLLGRRGSAQRCVA